MTTPTTAAFVLTRLDRELSLDEALLLLAIPERATSPAPEPLSRSCHRCGYDTDHDRYCVMCGEVSLAA